MSTELALITKSDLSLIEDNALNEKQLKLLLQKTPAKYVHKRPAKGGGEWEYVTGGYVKKVLNLMFGWDWDFEIINQQVIFNEAIVQGKLTVRTNGKTIVKTQFGNKDIIYKKGTEIPLSIGNDLKAAATDCLKKCSAELGISADIYNKIDFRETIISSETDVNEILNKIKNLYTEKITLLSKEDVRHIERVIDNKEVNAYNKVLKLLTELCE
jgi:recombination DNA repair RAD52 pathway protein